MNIEDELRSLASKSEADRKAQAELKALLEREAVIKSALDLQRKIMQLEEESREVSKQFIAPYLAILNNVLAGGKGKITLTKPDPVEIDRGFKFNPVTSLNWDHHQEGFIEQGKRVSFVFNRSDQKVIWIDLKSRSKVEAFFYQPEELYFNDPEYDTKMKNILKVIVTDPDHYKWSIDHTPKPDYNDERRP